MVTEEPTGDLTPRIHPPRARRRWHRTRGPVPRSRWADQCRPDRRPLPPRAGSDPRGPRLRRATARGRPPRGDPRPVRGAAPRLVEVFEYPGDRHLFTDSSLPSHAAAATEEVLARSLEFLNALRW